MSREDRRTRAPSALRDQSAHSFQEIAPEEPPSPRQARLERLVLDGLQSFVRDEASDPKLGGIRLLGVTFSIDGGQATVAYAVEGVLGEERTAGPASLGALSRAQGFLRARLGEQLGLKRTPKLKFTFVGIVEGGDAW